MRARSSLAPIILALVLAGCATLDHQRLPRPEQGRYFELAAVAAGDEAEEYLALEDSSSREEYWRKFWKSQDPTPTTDRNERYEEHLRRVAYAAERFSSHIGRWDDRGRVYVKYGEPDERESHPMGSGPQGIGLERASEASNDACLPDPARKADLALTRGWEMWTYSRLARQFKFVSDGIHYRMVGSLAAASDWENRALSTTASLSADEVPQHELDQLPASDYRHDYGQPLDFTVNLDRFADSLGAEVWLSYGLPLAEIGHDSVGNGLVERRVVINDGELREVARDCDVLTPRMVGDRKALADAQAVDVCRFRLETGEYTAAISLFDFHSGKTGIYRIPFRVIDYRRGEEPASDLLLALDIARSDDSTRFTKDGYRIVPQPGRAFRRGKTLFFYYELYNLGPDAGGACRVSATYYIVLKDSRRALRTDPEILERKGTILRHASGLTLTGLKPGEYLLLAGFRDMNSGKTRTLIRGFSLYE